MTRMTDRSTSDGSTAPRAALEGLSEYLQELPKELASAERPSLLFKFESCLKKLHHPSPFAISGIAPHLPDVPGLSIEGLGKIGLPLNEEEAKRLAQVSVRAPYGKKYDTKVDLEVRDTLQIDPSKVHFLNPKWQDGLEELLDEIHELMEFSKKNRDNVHLSMYKLLLYGPGGHFVQHKDTVKEDGMFATLVIQLPSWHQGGELIATHGNKVHKADFGVPANLAPYHCHYAIHYSDVDHQLLPVKEGYRLAVVYNVCRRRSSLSPMETSIASTSITCSSNGAVLPSARALQGSSKELCDLISQWEDQVEELTKQGSKEPQIEPEFHDDSAVQVDEILESAFIPLQFEYTEQNLTGNGVNALKGEDRELYEILKNASDSKESNSRLCFYIVAVNRCIDYYDADSHSYATPEWEKNQELHLIPFWFTKEGLLIGQNIKEDLNLSLKNVMILPNQLTQSRQSVSQPRPPPPPPSSSSSSSSSPSNMDLDSEIELDIDDDDLEEFELDESETDEDENENENDPDAFAEEEESESDSEFKVENLIWGTNSTDTYEGYLENEGLTKKVEYRRYFLLVCPEKMDFDLTIKLLGPRSSLKKLQVDSEKLSVVEFHQRLTKWIDCNWKRRSTKMPLTVKHMNFLFTKVYELKDEQLAYNLFEKIFIDEVYGIPLSLIDRSSTMTQEEDGSDHDVVLNEKEDTFSYQYFQNPFQIAQISKNLILFFEMFESKEKQENIFIKIEKCIQKIGLWGSHLCKSILLGLKASSTHQVSRALYEKLMNYLIQLTTKEAPNELQHRNLLTSTTNTDFNNSLCHTMLLFAELQAYDGVINLLNLPIHTHRTRGQFYKKLLTSRENLFKIQGIKQALQEYLKDLETYVSDDSKTAFTWKMQPDPALNHPRFNSFLQHPKKKIIRLKNVDDVRYFLRHIRSEEASKLYSVMVGVSSIDEPNRPIRGIRERNIQLVLTKTRDYYEKKMAQLDKYRVWLHEWKEFCQQHDRTKVQEKETEVEEEEKEKEKEKEEDTPSTKKRRRLRQ